MQKHTLYGAKILGDHERLKMARLIALSHHERWDGRGYPNGLRGEDIPLPGRICAIADVFDALTNDRPYRKAIPNEKAKEILREVQAKFLDPETS